MAEQTGIRIFITRQKFLILPALMHFPEDALVSAILAPALWRNRPAFCFEVRTTGLDVRRDNGMIVLFRREQDGGDHRLYSFPEQSVIGITDPEDHDIIPETAPSWKPARARTVTSIPVFLPHLHDYPNS